MYLKNCYQDKINIKQIYILGLYIHTVSLFLKEELMKFDIERFIKQNKATILAVAGAVGMTVSVGLAIRNTAKYKDIIHSKDNKKIDNIERLKVAVPLYLPVVLLTGSSLACIVSATVLNTKRQRSMTAAYILLENGFKQYRDKVAELYGSDATQKVETEITNDKFEEKNPQLEILENDLFYDEYRGEFFESTLDYVREAMYHVNRNFILRGYSTLNEVYDFLNLSHTEQGDILGWSTDYGWCDYGYSWIDYYCDRREFSDGIEYYAIVFPFPPTIDSIEDLIDLQSFSPNLIDRAKAITDNGISEHIDSYNNTQNLQSL